MGFSEKISCFHSYAMLAVTISKQNRPLGVDLAYLSVDSELGDWVPFPQLREPPYSFECVEFFWATSSV